MNVDQYENAKASSERVFGLMDIPVRVQDEPDATELEDVEGRVEYEDVTFGYEADAVGADGSGAGAGSDSATGVGTDRENGVAVDGETVIEDVSFEADPGETVALVGPTGAGKSTLVKLLLRLYDVNEGAVRVDGHDVTEVTLDSLRGAIGYVGQDTFLFDGSIADNIRYGNFDASDNEVVAAAKAAEAHEFIEGLSDGYETRVGERGVKLSGASVSASASRGRSCRTPQFWCSTRPRPPWTPRPNSPSSAASRNSPATARPSRSPIASRPSPTPTRSSLSKAAGSSNAARTTPSASRTASTPPSGTPRPVTATPSRTNS